MNNTKKESNSVKEKRERVNECVNAYRGMNGIVKGTVTLIHSLISNRIKDDMITSSLSLSSSF
jgi:hypothetical protein